MFSWLKKRMIKDLKKMPVNVCSGAWDEHKSVCNIYKDDDGDYWFLCRAEHFLGGDEKSYEVDVGSLFERDPTLISPFLNLQEQKVAFRRCESDQWRLVPKGDLTTFQKIEEFGWIVFNVTDGRNSFSYTIGLLENFNYPELLIFGLSSDARYEILNKYCNIIKEHDKNICLNEHLIADGLVLSELPASRFTELVGTAIRFYGDKSILVKQLEQEGASTHEGTARE
jgi:hypothetical protein